MSFLTEDNYEYHHLPHTKTIDLIGEEFAPKRAVAGGGGNDVICSAPNVVVVSAVPASLGGNLIQTTTAAPPTVTGPGPQLIPVSMAMSNATTLTTTEVMRTDDFI